MNEPRMNQDFAATLLPQGDLTAQQRDAFITSLNATEDCQPVRFWKSRAEHGLEELNATARKYRATNRYGASHSFFDFMKRLDKEEKEEFLDSFNDPHVRAEMERAMAERPLVNAAMIGVIPASAGATVVAAAAGQELDAPAGVWMAIALFAGVTTALVTGFFAGNRGLRSELRDKAHEGSVDFFDIKRGRS